MEVVDFFCQQEVSIAIWNKRNWTKSVYAPNHKDSAIAIHCNGMFGAKCFSFKILLNFHFVKLQIYKNYKASRIYLHTNASENIFYLPSTLSKNRCLFYVLSTITSHINNFHSIVVHVHFFANSFKGHLFWQTTSALNIFQSPGPFVKV